MKKIILIGTSHSIQKGEVKRQEFEYYIKSLYSKYSIKQIAEETKESEITIGKNMAKELGVDYIVIEPKPEDYKSLGIEEMHKVIYNLQQKSELWPPPEIEDFNPVLKHEYDKRLIQHMQAREKVWLQKVLESDIYPTLVTCGADHFESFSSLLKENSIEVIEEANRWGVD